MTTIYRMISQTLQGYQRNVLDIEREQFVEQFQSDYVKIQGTYFENLPTSIPAVRCIRQR